MNGNSQNSSEGMSLASPPAHKPNGAGGVASSLIPQPLFDDIVHVFRLLADETRMQILFLLMRDAELHVGALCKLLGHSQPSVSHHLALLKEGGLIDVRRDGKHNYYRLLPARFQELLRAFTAEVPLSAQQHSVLDGIRLPGGNGAYTT